MVGAGQPPCDRGEEGQQAEPRQDKKEPGCQAPGLVGTAGIVGDPAAIDALSAGGLLVATLAIKRTTKARPVIASHRDRLRPLIGGAESFVIVVVIWDIA